MNRVDQVRQLAAEGKWGRRIAVELGISPQRVSQIAKQHEINLPKYVEPPRTETHSPPRPPVPRVVTGGIPVPITSIVAGSICEMLVAADLMARGFYVYMPAMPSRFHDLIAVSRADDILTIESRAAKRVDGKVVFARKDGCTSRYYALVIVGEPVVYVPDLPASGAER